MLDERGLEEVETIYRQNKGESGEYRYFFQFEKIDLNLVTAYLDRLNEKDGVEIDYELNGSEESEVSHLIYTYHTDSKQYKFYITEESVYIDSDVEWKNEAPWRAWMALSVLDEVGAVVNFRQTDSWQVMQ